MSEDGHLRRYSGTSVRPETPRVVSFRPVVAQIALTVAGAVCALPFSLVVAYSILLGGLCCFVPGAFAAYRMSIRTVRVSEAASHLAMAQFGKIGLTVLMLIVVFMEVQPLAAPYFFGTMVVVQFAYLGEPMVRRSLSQN